MTLDDSLVFIGISIRREKPLNIIGTKAEGRAGEFLCRSQEVTGHPACSANPEKNGQDGQSKGKCHSPCIIVIMTKGPFFPKGRIK